MKKYLYKTLVSLLTMMVVTTANSATLVCAGTVTELAYHNPGTLYVRLSGMNTHVAICSVDSNWAPAGSVTGATTPAACKTIFTSLLVAKQAGTQITSMYFDGEVLPATCSTFPSWTSVNLRFFSFA